MFRQKVILNFDSDKQDLFLRRDGNVLSFDTYFNSLNLFLIKHYTDGKNLTVLIESKGNSKVEIVHETSKEKKVLYSSDSLVRKIEINLEKLGELGIIYPVFSGNFELLSLSYEVDAPSRKTSTAVIFTTFNRQEFLIPNLHKLDTCEFVDKVVVVDNAKNVVLPNSLSKGKVVLVPNANLGGSGGFTRGLMEAKKLGVSHVFMMDDDITLLPEIVDKALSLISCLKEECKDNWLGFSMLPHSAPTVQFELGSFWSGKRMVINHHNMDVAKKENLFINQVNTKINYSAWWSLIMPSSVIDKQGLPFPFFIKFDDIEYALRRDKEEIILSNGFGVWHEDFTKKYNPYLQYYSLRNSLVTNALHVKCPCHKSVLRFLAKNINYYLKGHFIEMKLMNMAVNNYLAGPDYFLGLDIEKRNTEIREIAKQKVNKLKGIFVYPLLTICYILKLRFKYNGAKRKFRARIKELTSAEYWENVFNHD